MCFKYKQHLCSRPLSKHFCQSVCWGNKNIIHRCTIKHFCETFCIYKKNKNITISNLKHGLSLKDTKRVLELTNQSGGSRTVRFTHTSGSNSVTMVAGAISIMRVMSGGSWTRPQSEKYTSWTSKKTSSARELRPLHLDQFAQSSTHFFSWL